MAAAPGADRHVARGSSARWSPAFKRSPLNSQLATLRSLTSHFRQLEQGYIFVKLDHRWPHAQEIAQTFQKECGGIPWCAILDADQNVLATSDGPDGNIGFPAKDEPQGIEHFLKMLRDSRIRLSDADLDGLRASLEGREGAAPAEPKREGAAPAEPTPAKTEPASQANAVRRAGAAQRVMAVDGQLSMAQCSVAILEIPRTILCSMNN